MHVHNKFKQCQEFPLCSREVEEAPFLELNHPHMLADARGVFLDDKHDIIEVAHFRLPK